LASAYTGMMNQLVVVLVNLSKEDKFCDLGFSQSVDVFTTSQKMNLEKSCQNAKSCHIPARAVVSVLAGN